MGSFGNSWALMKISLRVIRKDKELLLFPIFSLICCLIVLASFIGVFFIVGLPTLDTSTSIILWVVYFFIMYFLLYFFIIFFNTAIVGCATIRLTGGDPTIRDGFRIASQRIGKILVWTLVSATVGVILQAIRERGGWVGKIVAGIIGFAWTYATFFIIPVLIYEEEGVWGSVKRSVDLFKRTWGETFTGSFGFGIIFVLLALLGILPVVAGGLVTGGFTGVIVGLTIAFIYWIVIGALAAAANGVYVAALYQFATRKQLPTVFEASMIPTPVSGF
jgi:hypothetical protein